MDRQGHRRLSHLRPHAGCPVPREAKAPAFPSREVGAFRRSGVRTPSASCRRDYCSRQRRRGWELSTEPATAAGWRVTAVPTPQGGYSVGPPTAPRAYRLWKPPGVLTGRVPLAGTLFRSPRIPCAGWASSDLRSPCTSRFRRRLMVPLEMRARPGAATGARASTYSGESAAPHPRFRRERARVGFEIGPLGPRL